MDEVQTPLLEVQANLDLESYKTYYWFTMMRNPTIWLLLAFMAILTAVFSMSSRVDPWKLVFFPTIIAFYLVIIAITGPRTSYRAQPKLNTESDLTYLFYEGCYQIIHKNQLSSGIQTNSYEHIKCAFETKHGFYLQTIEKNRATHVLDKKYFGPEQIEALRGLLARRFGGKFKGMKG